MPFTARLSSSPTQITFLNSKNEFPKEVRITADPEDNRYEICFDVPRKDLEKKHRLPELKYTSISKNERYFEYNEIVERDTIDQVDQLNHLLEKFNVKFEIRRIPSLSELFSATRPSVNGVTAVFNDQKIFTKVLLTLAMGQKVFDFPALSQIKEGMSKMNAQDAQPVRIPGMG